MTFSKCLPAVIVGLVGWTGGIYSERLDLFKSMRIFAARSFPSTYVPIVPVEPPHTSSRSEQIMRFGFPGFDTIRSKNNYVLSYDRRNRVASWVLEHLTKESVKYDQNVGRAESEFFEDGSIHSFFRARRDDYKGTGYDRGHLAAAGNHRSSQDLLNETFALSNIAPQVGKGFNRDSWNRLEKHVRRLTKKYKNVYVCTGPLYLPRIRENGKKYIRYEVIGPNNVAVPTHFFKVVVCETENQEYDLESYVMENAPIDDNTPLESFLVPKESIERAAGLLFFEKIPNDHFRKVKHFSG